MKSSRSIRETSERSAIYIILRRRVRIAFLAMVGGHSVKTWRVTLHTGNPKNELLKDFTR